LPNILRKKNRINPFWFHIHFIKAFLDALGLEKVNLAGISMGGAIALGFALHYPGCLQKLVLVNSHGLGEKLPGIGLMYLFSRTPFLYESFRWLLQHSRRLTALGMRRLVYSRETLNDEMIEDAWRTLKNSGMHATWKAFQLCEITPGKFRSHFGEQLKNVAVPTLIVHGREDKLIPLTHSEDAHRLIPNSELAVLHDCGHLTPREKPEEFNRILTGFLDG
jgi:pimeloyl-ACP methyl ester carboxylesterase